MAYQTRQKNLTPQQWEFHGITAGTVVDTNDPQQMGRVRAVCASLGDDINAPIIDIPWASYASPFAGTTQVGTSGPSDDERTGPVAYGMWGIPKVGATVLIMCLDGDPQTRVWIGCLPVQFGTHTMPHGRYTHRDDDALPESTTKPVGPLTSFETTVEPLSTNFKAAFGDPPAGNHNYEFATRAADFQVSAVTKDIQLEQTTSLVLDDNDIATGVANSSLTESRQGYQTSRLAPDQVVPERIGPRNLDNMVTSLVSPGFHAISMDDRQENSRIRIRTIGGHQIIMDDTNERVYISTAKGENWIEIDEAGNIDIYTKGKLSAHAVQDINFTTDASFRVYAKKGIQLNSDIETRITSQSDVSIKSTRGVIRTKSEGDTFIESAQRDIELRAGTSILATAKQDLHIKGNNTFIDASSTGNIKAGAALNINARGTMNLLGGSIVATGGTIDLNGPNAAPATAAREAGPADEGNNFNALFVNRVPQHEPWPRVDIKDDKNSALQPQFEYTSDQVGKIRRVTASDGISFDDQPITRGSKWRR